MHCLFVCYNIVCYNILLNKTVLKCGEVEMHDFTKKHWLLACLLILDNKSNTTPFHSVEDYGWTALSNEPVMGWELSICFEQDSQSSLFRDRTSLLCQQAFSIFNTASKNQSISSQLRNALEHTIVMLFLLRSNEDCVSQNKSLHHSDYHSRYACHSGAYLLAVYQLCTC